MQKTKSSSRIDYAVLSQFMPLSDHCIMKNKKNPIAEMKTEKIITTWMGAAIMMFNVMPQIKHEGIKTAIICMTTSFTIVLYIWLICKKKDNGN